LNNRENFAVCTTTRAAAKGQPSFISASHKLYCDSFLPRTIRDIRILNFSIETLTQSIRKIRLIHQMRHRTVLCC